MVIEEITDKEQSFIISKYLFVEKLLVDAEVSFDEIQKMTEEHPGLSSTDCSVIELAIRKKGSILSSDKSLRNEAKRRKIIVRGVLWVIETLLQKGIISLSIAIEKLELLPKINQRAPLNEISLLIKKLDSIYLKTN